MKKTYYDFIKEISADELYDGLLGYGLFSEKLPPIFTSKNFLDYCKKQKQPPSSTTPTDYIHFDSIRNINIPRSFGIPNPITYQSLCSCLKKHWKKIQQHFYEKTHSQKYKISQTHLRKRKDTKSLFLMNYKNWKTDDNANIDFLVGSRYIVYADISTCFPSIYTHSIPWALVGKTNAKQKKGDKQWYNEIDTTARNINNQETKGLLIGTHASNLLSEIILVTIDKALHDNGWKYIRFIDDFKCYVSSYSQGQKFLIDLENELHKFKLLLNFKKVNIQKLPIPLEENWVQKLKTYASLLLSETSIIKFNQVSSFLDFTINLMKQNDDNSSILKYAIKILSSKKTLSKNAIYLYTQYILHLSLLYPYIIPLLDEYIFKPFKLNKNRISDITQKIYSSNLKNNNFEGVYYSIFFALEYDFKLDDNIVDKSIENDSCLFKILSYLYAKKYNNKTMIKKLKSHAKDLYTNAETFEQNWLFVYEALSINDLKAEWKAMKKNNVSFIKNDFLY